MFVLYRGHEESVIVDGFKSPTQALKVTVLETKGGRVKLGIEVHSDSKIDQSHEHSTKMADCREREWRC